jgi:hypothetical protein
LEIHSFCALLLHLLEILFLLICQQPSVLFCLSLISSFLQLRVSRQAIQAQDLLSERRIVLGLRPAQSDKGTSVPGCRSSTLCPIRFITVSASPSLAAFVLQPTSLVFFSARIFPLSPAQHCADAHRAEAFFQHALLFLLARVVFVQTVLL